MAAADNVIFYFQDQGASRFLLPSFLAFAESNPRANWRLIVHSISAGLFAETSCAYESAADAFGAVPADAESLAAFFESAGPSARVVCTTSARERDMTNARLIDVARQCGLPTLAVFDHWKGYSRFLDSAGTPAYLPDQLCCIDEHCAERLRSMYPECDPIIVGHPHLEQCRTLARRDGSSCRVLVVSQPENRDGTFRSVFSEDWQGRTILQSLADHLPRTVHGRPVEIYFRPHPKETGNAELPLSMRVDPCADWSEALLAYDVFLGRDSMPLIEAAISGREVAIIGWPESPEQPDTNIPFAYGPILTKASDLPEFLTRSTTEHHAEPGKPTVAATFDGSTQRLSTAITNFLHVKSLDSVSA